MSKHIIKYPNEILRQISAPIGQIDNSILELIAEMKVIMNEAGGVGLSAIQVGEPLRVFVMKYKGESIALINPTLDKANGVLSFKEGCLSFPRLYTERGRFARISVSYLNEQGKHQVIESDESDPLTTACIQHEIDHLDGKLFIDIFSQMRKLLLIKQMNEAKRK